VAQPLPLAEAKPWPAAADEGAELVGQRVCRGWRIMLPDGRCAHRWLEGTIVAVLPGSGELSVAFDNGTTGALLLREAKEMCSAACDAIEE